MAVSKSYVRSTLGYGAVAVLGALGLVRFLGQGKWFLALICAAIIFVSLDNFFCSDRVCRAGGKAEGKYCVPPFLRNEKGKKEKKGL